MRPARSWLAGTRRCGERRVGRNRNSLRSGMKPYIAEFVGTALLVLLGNGVVANVVLPKTKGSGSGWIVITFGWGMAVFVAVWCVGPISGAHLNPAVTLGLCAAKKFAWKLLPGFVAAQLFGAMVGAL